MKTLSNTDAELEKRVAYIKAVYSYLLITLLISMSKINEKFFDNNLRLRE